MAKLDIYGNIAVLKFGKEDSLAKRKREANKFLKERKSVSTVLEKVGKFSGRLRKQKTRWLAGEKTSEALCRENGCSFRFNVDSCYYSPRMSSERKELAGMIKKKENVLVMFGGIAPHGIVIAKARGQNSKALSRPPARSKFGRIVSVEISRDCSKYAKENVKRNKVSVEIIQGDVRKKVSGKYDRIVMSRPNLEDSFLDVAFKASKKGTIIHYYGFYEEIEKIAGVIEELIDYEARKAKKKVGIIGMKKIGEIGTRKFRYRVDIKVIS